MEDLNNPLFVTVPEWSNGVEISSAHTGVENAKQLPLPNTFVLFVYPRAFTPVCNAELIKLQEYYEKDSTIQIIAASTDSPEAQQQFYFSQEYFPKEFILPSVTIKPPYLTSEGEKLLLSDEEYSLRVTIAVKDNKVVYVHREFSDEQRSLEEFKRMIKKLKK